VFSGLWTSPSGRPGRSLSSGRLRYALAEEWTYRYLAAARSWVGDEADAERRVHGVPSD
jgi:hypothetical protein